MLETISKGFSIAKNLLKKETTLTENNISEALKEVKLALLEADVEYNVAKNFLERVKEKSLGLVVKTQAKDQKKQVKKLSPYEHFINICHEELLTLMGPQSEDLSLKSPLAIIMMAGLQGSGKTTSSAKLARLLKEEHKKNPLLVAADIYRPGAASQLEILGQKLGVEVFHIPGASAQDICKAALEKAKQNKNDVLILDTAGRLAIDDHLMNELLDIKSLTNPDHIFLVIDSMIGQDAITTASLFDKKLDLNGFILTKLDGDTRGGAAISIKEITKKPIRFTSFGEDLQSFELFRPEGLASRILGMGDIVSLAKDFEKHVTEEDAQKDINKLLKGSFSLDDFLKQLNMIKKIGSFKSILERIPGMQDMMPAGINIDEKEFTKFEAMILSMTKKERANPQILVKEKSRKLRITKGSGTKLEELDQLIDRFLIMRNMMSGFGKTNGQKPDLKALNKMSEMAKLRDNPFGSSFNEIKPKVDNKQKKDKRKSQKQARKKNKKR